MTDTDFDSIAQRRDAILGKIDLAAKVVSRSDVPSLIAVSKVQPDERIEELSLIHI